MTTQLHNVLSVENKHERDSHIVFEEEGHKYTITCDANSTYTSVTTWNHKQFPIFDANLIIKNMMRGKNWKEGHKYWGLTGEQIKEQWSNNGSAVSSAGTNMHYEIECFMNNPTLKAGYTHHELINNYYNDNKENKENKENKNNQNNLIYSTLEWKYFLEFVKDNPTLKPYRTEWTIYHEELKLAGSIDMIYENEDGTLSIYDWKRCKDITRINTYNKFAVTKCISHMPDSNFWHYTLQLNTYKSILEDKYGKVIKELFLVRLHPDAEEKTYELIPLPILKREIDDLNNERLKLVTKTCD